MRLSKAGGFEKGILASPGKGSQPNQRPDSNRHCSDSGWKARYQSHPCLGSTLHLFLGSTQQDTAETNAKNFFCDLRTPGKSPSKSGDVMSGRLEQVGVRVEDLVHEKRIGGRNKEEGGPWGRTKYRKDGIRVWYRGGTKVRACQLSRIISQHTIWSHRLKRAKMRTSRRWEGQRHTNLECIFEEQNSRNFSVA